MTRPWRWLVLLAVSGCYFETPTHGTSPSDENDSAILGEPGDEGDAGDAGDAGTDNEGGSPSDDEGGTDNPNDAGMDASRDPDGSIPGGPDASSDGGAACRCDAGSPVCIPSTNQCVQCNASNNSACTGDKPVCDLSTFTCVACTQDSQCANPARAKCDLASHSCVPCDAKAQCAHVSGLPVCSSGTCVQCSASDATACTGTTKPFCQTNGNTCVACNTNANCTDPTKPTCDANVCRACQNDNDCMGKMSGATALDACYNGQCVDCRVNASDTKQDVGCSASTSCNPATRTCTGKAKGSIGICAPCLADAECGDSHRCITMTHRGTEVRPGGASGGFCLRRTAAGACTRPYGAPAITRASRSGAAADSYCGVNESLATCDAIRAYATTCATGGSPCSIPEGRDALGARCETMTTGPTCTYSCSSGNNNECPSNTTCPSGTSPYCQ